MKTLIDMSDWIWQGEDECWRLTQRWERWYPNNKRSRKWITDIITVSVAGVPDRYDVGLLARASWYATQVDVLEAIAGNYLKNRPIRVYGGNEGLTLVTEVSHPMCPSPELCEIKIPDVAHPTRVHVVVDTYYPDPYFLYELVFEQMTVVDAFGGFQ
ncbi:MAG: hypothetical protein AAGB19_12335 [Cyanobacteria bacterium P01_F01_bin.3]